MYLSTSGSIDFCDMWIPGVFWDKEIPESFPWPLTGYYATMLCLRPRRPLCPLPKQHLRRPYYHCRRAFCLSLIEQCLVEASLPFSVAVDIIALVLKVDISTNNCLIHPILFLSTIARVNSSTTAALLSALLTLLRVSLNILSLPAPSAIRIYFSVGTLVYSVLFGDWTLASQSRSDLLIASTCIAFWNW
jgi:hypothetical protein